MEGKFFFILIFKPYFILRIDLNVPLYSVAGSTMSQSYHLTLSDIINFKHSAPQPISKKPKAFHLSQSYLIILE